ncbi:MAG: spore cortex-lytic enzyme [Clostridia bacterium]|nr:spore cortex-lytic enzyme [Clostridia bacterium]
MKKIIKNRKIIAIINIIAVSIVFFTYNFSLRNNESFALSRYGSTGSEVTQIQTKLKRWGYYTGNVDGVYGSKTVAAVRRFQSKNGLTVDGVAGPKTLAAMGIVSSSSGGGQASNSDLNLLAHLIYAEARGEPYSGQVGVGAVVLNRVKSSKFPNSVAGVIYQPGAFDVVSDGQINYAPNTTAINAARDALNGWDPTYGCIYYFNPNTATSKWIWSRPYVITIGNHRFCR